MNELSIIRAVTVLRNGGVIAYPTEAVFGIGCDPNNETAVKRVISIKNRSPNKGLILIASDIAQIEMYIGRTDPKKKQTAFATWPGPYTWVFPASDNVPAWIRGSHTSIAVRVTAHPVAAAICKKFGGPIVSTSANRSGKQSTRNAMETRLRFGGSIDFVVYEAVGGQTSPTEIRDVLTGRLIRPSQK